MPRHDRDGNLIFYSKPNPVADLQALSFAREFAQMVANDPMSPDEPDLSGQWADRLSGPDLVKACLFEGGYHPDDEDATDRLFTEICDAYEETYIATREHNGR